MSDEVERQIRDVAWSKAWRLTWAMGPAPALYVLAGFLLMRQNARLPARLGEASDAVFAAFVAASVACAVAAAWLSRRLRSAEPPPSLSAAAMAYVQRHVLTLMLAEVPAALGLVYFLLSGDLRRMTVLAAAAMALILFFLPSRATLERFVRRGGRERDASS